jgi:flagellar hook-length control protein FliK
MQATDLLLGLMTDKRTISQDPLPQKADDFQFSGNSFQSLFDKAVSRPAPKAEFNNLASNNRNDYQPAAKEAPKTTAISAYHAQKAERTNPAAAQTVSTAKTSADADETQMNAAQQTDPGQDTQSTNDKMDALIDRIKQEIAKGKDQTDEQMVELLLQLIAMMLAAAQESLAGKATDATDNSAQALNNAQNGGSGVSNLKVALNLDPNSNIAKILDLLMNGKEGLTENELKGVNILLKLTGDKGLLIPLSELVKNSDAAQDGDSSSAKFTLQLTDATDASKTVEMNLAISADDVKSAQLVNLSDPALQQSDIVMVIPLEKFSNDSVAKAELQKMLEELAQKGLQNLTDAALSDEEKAALAAGKDDVKAEIVLPLKSDTRSVKSDALNLAVTENTAEKPNVETADPMFLNSDKYLKGLQVENLAKELATGGTDKREIFDRLQKLLFADDPNVTNLEKILVSKKDSAFSFLKDWTQNFSNQTKPETSGWTSNLAKELNSLQASNAPADNIPAERVVFLGRAEAANDLSQIVAEKTVNTPRAAQSQNLGETVMQQIVQRASYVFQNGAQGEIRIMLRPENLGDVSLKVKMEQDIVTAKFVATSNEVKAIIENNLGQLKNALDQMGIKVGKFEVQVDTGSGQQPQQQARQGGSDSFNFGQGYSASEAAGTYGETLGLDYENAALYGSDGSMNADLGRVSYFA